MVVVTLIIIMVVTYMGDSGGDDGWEEVHNLI